MSDLAYLLEGDLDEEITWRGHTTMYGGLVKGSRRSIAHLEATDQECFRRFGVHLGIIQSAYNRGVEASAGTHDEDAVYDLYIPGVAYRTAERFMREMGWACWYRFPPAFGYHLHAISLGYRTQVGIYVPGQVDDYYRHALGLKGQHDSGDDPTWHPDDIDSTIFDFALWAREMEDEMGYSEWTDKDKKLLRDDMGAVVQDVVEGELKVVLKSVRQQVAAVRARLREDHPDVEAIRADVEAIAVKVGADRPEND